MKVGPADVALSLLIVFVKFIAIFVGFAEWFVLITNPMAMLMF
jgi:hypothetical protein